MKRRIFSLIAALCCLVVFALPVSAARPYENCIANCKLYDPDNLFTETEQEELSRLIRQTSDDTDQYVAVCIINDGTEQLSDYETMRFADDRYDEMFNPQYGVDTDGVLLVLNMPTHYIYISTSGMGQLYYSNSPQDNRINRIVDGLTPHLQNKDNVGAVQSFCSYVKSYRNQGAKYHAYTYNSDTHMYSYEKNGELVSSKNLPFTYRLNMAAGLLIGLIAGGLTMLISFLVIKSSYKFRKSLSASNYISDKETTFYQRDDMFIRTHTSKSRIDTDRGGGGGFSGGGSSHSSSGGHSHGGGGGHW
ncbi:MAG: TPM domain-containing protein [Oscillospiraceae bacterium]|nr:TPM domain-containing protein [Oscillospiraceae bacterium]